jgi:hypothetical protein
MLPAAATPSATERGDFERRTDVRQEGSFSRLARIPAATRAISIVPVPGDEKVSLFLPHAVRGSERAAQQDFCRR